MKILAIETSCDETAIAILEIRGGKRAPDISILGNALHSQVKLHEQYGGVFPMMAKREHARILTPLLRQVLREAKELRELRIKNYELSIKKIHKTLEREGELAEELLKVLTKIKKPKIDCIAVTNGPGLEPALWVGINFAKALSLAWKIPVMPINHMEGHIFSAFLVKKAEKQFTINNSQFPILSLLISGGHTQLVLMSAKGGPASGWKYKILGETRDDAVGEAFDKVARMLGLPYPGGPQISKLAEEARQLGREASKLSEKPTFPLPRPMIHSKDFDFSFSGLKTAVLYTLKKITKLTETIKKEIALEFENAVTDVLIAKTQKALVKTKAQTFIIGGGVSANKHIRASFAELIKSELPKVGFLLPTQAMSTDNAIMIGLVAYHKFNAKKKYSKTFKANGNLTF